MVEGGNGGHERAGRGSLFERGVHVLPDILASAGGVVGSYFEWVQDLQENFWPAEQVAEQLELVMTRAAEEVLRAQAPRRHQHAPGGYDARRRARGRGACACAACIP